MLALRILRSSAASTAMRQTAMPLRISIFLHRQASSLHISASSSLKQSSIARISPSRHDYNPIHFRSSIFPTFTSIRFKSTSSSSTSTSSSSSATIEPFDSPDAPISNDLDPLSFSELTEAQKSLSEHIGYLHELGLDFGWGPTSLIQWLLEHMHIWSGTPWWGSILLTTLAIRLIQFPFFIKVADESAKVKEVQPFVRPLIERYKAETQAKNPLGMQLASTQIRELYQKAGVNKTWLLFPLAQLPIFYGVYNLLRHMSDLPVPGFLTGGVAWFSDLTSADPYLMLPLLTSATLAYTIHIGGDSGSSNMSKQFQFGLKIGLPLISFLFMWKWPTALTMYFAFNGIVSLLQAQFLRNAEIRQKLGIYPLDTSPDAYNATTVEELQQQRYSYDSAPAFRTRGVANTEEKLKVQEESSKGILNKIKSLPQKVTSDSSIPLGGREWSIQSLKKRLQENSKRNRIQKYEQEKERKEQVEKDAYYEKLRRRREMKELDKEEL